MQIDKNDKIERVLQIYTSLMNGDIVNKAAAAVEYGVTERSIQRDIDDIRNFLELEVKQSGIIRPVIYDREKKGYRLEQPLSPQLTNAETLAICKILLDSRAFTRPEMLQMLDKLIVCCVPEDQRKLVADLISNEAFHYIEPHHQTIFLDTMWTLGEAIRSCRYVEIRYARLKGNKTVTRRVKPAHPMLPPCPNCTKWKNVPKERRTCGYKLGRIVCCVWPCPRCPVYIKYNSGFRGIVWRRKGVKWGQ